MIIQDDKKKFTQTVKASQGQSQEKNLNQQRDLLLPSLML